MLQRRAFGRRSPLISERAMARQDGGEVQNCHVQEVRHPSASCLRGEAAPSFSLFLLPSAGTTPYDLPSAALLARASSSHTLSPISSVKRLKSDCIPAIRVPICRTRLKASWWKSLRHGCVDKGRGARQCALGMSSRFASSAAQPEDERGAKHKLS